MVITRRQSLCLSDDRGNPQSPQKPTNKRIHRKSPKSIKRVEPAKQTLESKCPQPVQPVTSLPVPVLSLKRLQIEEVKDTHTNTTIGRVVHYGKEKLVASVC